MSTPTSLGLRARIAISLAVVMTLFIVLTEVTISRLVRVSLERSSADEPVAGEAGGGGAAAELEVELAHLRRLVLFYMITGAALAIVLGAMAITRTVVRPLDRITRAVERVAQGDLGAEVPVGGSGELVALGVNFNRMTRTLRGQRDELRERLADIERSSANLKAAQDSLIRAAKLASVGTLAAGVAHEIGNPIAGVLGLLDALEAEEDEAKRAGYRALVRREVERIDRIIAGLLAYARPARREEAREARCDPAEAMEHVRSLVRAQKTFDRVELVADLGPGLAPAISRDDLTQILVNLLLNAGQAMGGEGKVTVSIEAVEGWRPQLAVVSRPAISISVTDDGPGVPAEIADRIFDPFFTARESGAGSGLGLSICQSICERWGGELSLDRGHEGGARFVVTIPAAA
jgi:signal transduction histidine kinase